MILKRQKITESGPKEINLSLLNYCMKFIIACVCLSLSISSFSQTNLFSKFSPGLTLPGDGETFFNVFISAGAHIGKFVGLGPTVGFYKFPHDSKPVIPLGADLIAMDFKTNKAGPYFVLGLYYPIYSKEYSNSNSTTTIQNSTKATLQYKVGGGIALPVTNHKKIVLGAFYMPVYFLQKETVTTQPPIGPAQTSTRGERSPTELYSISIEVIL